MEARLRARGLKSRIRRKGKRGKPLNEQGRASNRTKSAVLRVIRGVEVRPKGQNAAMIRQNGR